MRTISNKWLIRNYFLLAALEGMVTLISILTAATDPSNVWLMGYSKTRLAISVAVLAITGVCAFIVWQAKRDPDRGQSMGKKMGDWSMDNVKFVGTLMVLGLVFLAGYYFYFLASQVTDNLVRVRLERLRPLLAWLVILDAQTVIFLPMFRNQGQKKIGLPSKTVRDGFIVFLICMLGIVFISWTRLGLDPDKIGWDNPGAPILAMQLFAVVAIGSSIMGIGYWVSAWIKNRPKINRMVGGFRYMDVVVGALIWLIAALMWGAEPMTPTYFSPKVRAPNFEYYPYSDASLHDIAGQNLILGEGYAPVAEKPLYSLFLGLTHLVVGQDYTDVISLQVAVLALFPVVLYLLASGFHHRLTGLFTAGLLIFRESNTIALSPQIRVSHSKLLMTDLPAAFLLALFVLALFWWLSKSKQRRYGAILSGGSLGVALLVRSQAILLIPVVLICFALIVRPTWKLFAEASGLFVIGVSVVILPWMWRNYQETGRFGYSQPRQARYIAKQYSLTPEDDDPGFPDGTSQEEFASLGFSKMFEFMRSYPGVVANFVTSHFIRNEISILFIFPVSYSNIATNNHGVNFLGVDTFIWQDCCSLNSFVAEAPFWGVWTGSLTPEASIAILINLALISLGIGIAWRRWRFLGLLPLFIHFAYSLSVAIARISGWRLILPVDWIAILYFSIGLAQIVLWGISYLSGKGLEESDSYKTRARDGKREKGNLFPYRATVGIGMAFLLIGASVPLAERLFSQKYDPLSETASIALLESQGISNNLQTQIAYLLEDDAAVAMIGRALYPRFYQAEEEEQGGRWSGEAYLYNRFTFYLAGPDAAHVVLPLNFPPAVFLNATDVLVFGCQRQGHVQAVAVVLINLDGQIYYLDEQRITLGCS